MYPWLSYERVSAAQLQKISKLKKTREFLIPNFRKYANSQFGISVL
jgi:hypothetical protein